MYIMYWLTCTGDEAPDEEMFIHVQEMKVVDKEMIYVSTSIKIRLKKKTLLDLCRFRNIIVPLLL